MSNLVKTLLFVALGLAAGILLVKFGCGDDEVKRVLEENRRVRAQVDSLEALNRQAQGRLDSLRREDARHQARIEALSDSLKAKQIIIIKTVRDLNVYKGTTTDLLRDLNEFVRSPLPALPDTNFAR